MTFKSLYDYNRSKPTKFAIFGDMGVYTWNNMANLQRDVTNNAIDFIVHLGDHAYNMNDNDGSRGDGYIQAFSDLIAHTPWIPTLGNHEYYDGDEFHRYDNQTHGGADIILSKTSKHWNYFFSIGHELGIAKSVPSGSSRWYSTDVGLVHFVVCDFNVYSFSDEKVYI